MSVKFQFKYFIYDRCCCPFLSKRIYTNEKFQVAAEYYEVLKDGLEQKLTIGDYVEKMEQIQLNVRHNHEAELDLDDKI